MRALAVSLALAATTATAQSGGLEAPAALTAHTLAPTGAERVRVNSAAAERGLRFLAARQTAEGCWTANVGHKMRDDYMVQHSAREQELRHEGHLGVTSLAAIAFLAGGHVPGRGRYGPVVEKALAYVMRQTDESGYITDHHTRMYSHAFATLFLAEVYGMAGGTDVKHALEHAVNWIVDCQNQQGGWRYNPFSREADLSVTVCQLQALRAAHNIGIQVPADTIDRAVAFVLRARTPAGYSAGLYYYKNEGRSARTKNREYAINAAAITSLYSAGIYDDALVQPALSFLAASYPELRYRYQRHYFYWYGNYYASQAFFQAGGERFESYYRRISADLRQSQHEDGRWSDDVGPGDVFATSVACVILQVEHQYLPIFQR